MLESLTIEGFRGLRSVTLEFAREKPTVLIGENGTGKSSVLDALAMLAALVQGNGGKAFHDRGGWAAVRWAGANIPMRFVVRFAKNSPLFAPEPGPVEYDLVIGEERGVPTVVSEQLRLFQSLPANPTIVANQGGGIGYALYQDDGDRIAVDTSKAQTGMLRVPVVSMATDTSFDAFPTLYRFRGAMKSLSIYGGFSGLVRDSAVTLPNSAALEDVSSIDRSGTNLVSALYTLREKHPHVWKSLERDIEAVFPWFQSLQLPPSTDARGALTLRWFDARANARLYLDDMSDGMRVYLATLAALHAPEGASILAFDEPERNLHPRAIQRLVSVMEQRAQRGPMLLATHSDRLLGFLEDPLESLRVMRFDPVKGAQIEKLDADLMREWLKEFSVTELRARNLLDGPRGDD